MKFQFKALVAALALSAAAVPAQAMMAKADSGDGSFILSVWNQAAGRSATFDLGFTYSQFDSLIDNAHATGTLSADGKTKSFSIDLKQGNYADAWSFISAATSGTGTATTYWALFAGDNEGQDSSVDGARGYYTTANSMTGLNTSNNSVTTVLAKMDTYTGNNNNLTNHLTVEDGASTTTDTSSAGARSANAYGTGRRAGGAGVVGGFGINTSVRMLQVLTNSSNVPTAKFMGNPNGAHTFSLSSNGLLTIVTPVPEADSYAMLLAGLGVLGLVARRRKA